LIEVDFMSKARTLAELRNSGYCSKPVRSEIRQNLIKHIQAGEALFPGIIGFGETVIPQMENAILSGHDLILLGERGQAKTRMMRQFVSLLDPEIPVVAGCEIHDDPYAPICPRCRLLAAEKGDALPLDWLPREKRYAEKLATPDVTIADLIGEVDPIKVAEGRYLSDEATIHFGLIARSHRGIFALNELPDLAEKIQVGLFNILEERDVQIRGFVVRLRLDVYLIASANPEDYTNRGRIITPLKDRFGSQIRTHYPLTRDDEVRIVEQEREPVPESLTVEVPGFIKDIVAELSKQARAHPEIDQRSGVSVRVSIHNMENLISNALRRALRLAEQLVVPRITDLPYLLASTTGKIQLEGLAEAKENDIFAELVASAVSAVFRDYLGDFDFEPFLQNFQGSSGVVVSEGHKSSEYARQAGQLTGIEEIFSRLGLRTPEAKASGLEFVLEGLHRRGQLHREEIGGRLRYHH
jgi:magnesium chelatase subunit I